MSPQGNGTDATVRDLVSRQKLFRRYTLVRILGRGGMGIVWLARDEELERDVALKFLPEMIVRDPAVLSDLKRETKRSLELTHPHIVRIHDFVQDDNLACISMEYVDGDTLSGLRVSKPSKVFEAPELYEWVKQWCEAMDYAHEQAQVVHCDLKPSNLMVNSKGSLKITDFGIARSLSDSATKLTATRPNSGTLVYMSPQQLAGEKPSHLDDIYSMGATLYELLTGRPPFYRGQIEEQIRNRKPIPMALRREELGNESKFIIPQVWEETIQSCLAKNAARRPQTAGDLAKRLTSDRTLEQHRRIQLPAKQPQERRKWDALRPRVHSFAGVVIVAGFVAAIALLYFEFPSPRPTLQKKAPAPEKNFAERAMKLREQSSASPTSTQVPASPSLSYPGPDRGTQTSTRSNHEASAAEQPLSVWQKWKFEQAKQAFEQKQFATAREFIDEAKHANPRDPAILTLRGKILIEQNDFDGAEADFNEVLRDNPYLSGALSNFEYLASRRNAVASAKPKNTNAAQSAGRPIYVVTASETKGLNVRSDHSAKSAVVEKLNRGDSVFLEGESIVNNDPPHPTTWQKVTTAKGATGWIASEYISPSDVAAQQTPAASSQSQAPVDADAKVRELFERWFRVSNEGNAEQEASLFANYVTYLDFGTLTRDEVRQELQKDRQRWPQQLYSSFGKAPAIQKLSDSEWRVTFEISFDVRNSSELKRVTGTATLNWIVRKNPEGTFQIASSKEQVTSRRYHPVTGNR